RKVAEMQAHIVRLDAVARRLVAIDGGSLIQEGFDFDAPPALGGPENPIESPSFQPPPYMESLELLSQEIVEREQGLRLLEALFTNNGKSPEKMEFGRPVSGGWLSSRYGYRRDPITGKRAWHQGIDFAGREGADVLAMADGYVRFAGEKAGYGKMIEITHLDGYVTRYGHHKELLVKATDLVQKGDVIGRMGRTGRATGYHVHLEVIKDGKPVNPSSYLHRARR
ncbi:MAG: M23 family metallopeptidase, partial [Pseudomonadales bacterium]